MLAGLLGRFPKCCGSFLLVVHFAGSQHFSADAWDSVMSVA